MLKKILMAIGVLAIVGVIVVVGGSYYFINEITSEIEKREPEFRQYVTMTTKEQNDYVLNNVDEFFGLVLSITGASDEEIAEFKSDLKQLDNDPKMLQAKIDWGRSAVATFIVSNQNITKDLSPEVLQKFQTEKDELEIRQLKYKQILEEYKLKSKK